MIVKRLRPIYRLARRPIINGMKIKAISLNSYTNIKSSVEDMWILTSGNTKDTSPHPSTPNWH